MPKQFLKMMSDDKSLFQITLDRIKKLKDNLNLKEIRLIIVCNDNNKFSKTTIKETCIDLDFVILAEPINRIQR